MFPGPHANRSGIAAGSHEASAPPPSPPLSLAFSFIPPSEAQEPHRESEDKPITPESSIRSRKEGYQRQVSAQYHSRPGTAQSRLSRNVSGATARGFLRPMNSQTLQAQRSTLRSSMSNSSQRSPSQPTSPTYLYDDRNSHIDGSIDSNEHSSDRFLPASPWRMVQPATETTARNEENEAPPNRRASSNVSQTSETRFGSKIATPSTRENAGYREEEQGIGEQGQKQERGYGYDYESGHSGEQEHQDHQHQQISTSHSRSLRNEDADVSHSTTSLRKEGHRTIAASRQKKQKKHLGRNYEYFTGNVVFFCGGRFLNSKNWPVNLLTGVLQVLPAVLFFVYSYVPASPHAV